MNLVNGKREVLFESDKGNISEVLQEAIDTGTDLPGLLLEGHYIEGITFKQLNLSDMEVRNCTFYDVIIEESDLSSASFYHSKIEASAIIGCNLFSSRLQAVAIEDSRISGCDVSYSNWEGILIVDVSMEYCDLFSTVLLCYTDPVFTSLKATRGDGKWLKTIHVYKYLITYTSTQMQIGCRLLPIKDWFDSRDNILYRIEGLPLTHTEIVEWLEHRDIVETIITKYPAEKV